MTLRSAFHTMCLAMMAALFVFAGSESAQAKKKELLPQFTSAAALYGLQKPRPFKKLNAKLRKALEKGKIKVWINYRANELGKKKIVTKVLGIINKPPKAVFAQMAQLEKAHKFMPRMTYSKITKKISKTEYNVLRKISVAWKSIAMHIRIKLTPNKRYQFHLLRRKKNDIRDSVGAYNFEAIHGGKHTLVTYCLYSDSGRWIPGWVRRPLLRKDLPGVVRAMRKRVMSGGKWKK